MKKVIFFSKNLDIGGMEKALVAILNKLVERCEVTLVLEEARGSLIDKLNPQITIEEYALAKNRFIVVQKWQNFLHRFFWGIKNYHKYDFSCNYATYSFIGSKLAKLASANASIYVHSDYCAIYGDCKVKLEMFMKSHNLNRFKHVIFVSEESKEKMINVFPWLKEKAIVINNFVDYLDVEHASFEKVEDVMDKKNINLLAVCRLENESKNFDLMIKAFKKVVCTNESFRLYIVGDGPYKEKLKELIAKESLDEKVFLLGEKKNPYPYMRMCDALIMTSNYEGFPVTYQEALVLNKKFLTTIMVSDGEIDTRDYFVHVKRVPDNIAKSILDVDKKKFNYKLDFEKINESRMRKLESVIEVKQWKR